MKPVDTTLRAHKDTCKWLERWDPCWAWVAKCGHVRLDICHFWAWDTPFDIYSPALTITRHVKHIQTTCNIRSAALNRLRWGVPSSGSTWRPSIQVVHTFKTSWLHCAVWGSLLVLLEECRCDTHPQKSSDSAGLHYSRTSWIHIARVSVLGNMNFVSTIVPWTRRKTSKAWRYKDTVRCNLSMLILINSI